ncbi:MAG: hypothetical protein GEU74_06905 [Nitriliruptorales bacterium]|nr:hypothetical protein [Nitriliruptorales bacterium]
MRSGVLVAGVVCAVLVGCGEPPVAVDMPQRRDDRHVADLAQALGEHTEDLDTRLRRMGAAGRDIVALTYETAEASCGEAYRAANEFVRVWEADIAIVAVARPGDFRSTESDRRRCLGVQPRDERAVPAAVREQIAEQIVPPLAADNQWHEAFVAAAEALAEQ